jgi:hypothetical protein
MIEKTSLWLPMLIVLLGCGGSVAAQDTGGTPSESTFRLHVTHIMGFENATNNAAGELSLQGGLLYFEKSGSPAAQIAIPSIKDLYVGAEDRQVGGTPLAVTRAAMPYGGGRVVGIFSHKKYDIVTIQYVDSNNGLHAAIFQLDKGHGQILQDELAAARAQASHIDGQVEQPEKPGTSNDK